MTPEQSMLNATLTGYVAGLAWGGLIDGPERNPYAYTQPEAWNWQCGYEQGRDWLIVLAALSDSSQDSISSTVATKS